MKHTKHFIAAFCILPSSFFLLFSFFVGLGIWNLGLGTCFAQPTYTWANSIGNTGADEGRSIAVDGSGNVYITGSFTGTADFDPGAGTANLISAGSDDIFFAKYDASGNYLWAKSIGSTSGDGGNSIAVDGSGNVHITGSFQGTADFDPGAGTANLTSPGGWDIFVAKYTSAGTYLWAFKISSTNSEFCRDITVDGSGNVYITGSFGGTVDFDPGAGTANLTSAADMDIFVAKYTSAGTYLWAFKIGAANPDYGNSIAVDGSGNVHITGIFGWGVTTVDFDPGAGTANLTSAGNYDIFVAKYNTAGTYQWAFNLGSTAGDYGNSIAVDGSGNVYITGYFNGITGSGGTVDFDPGAGTANLTSAGWADIFVAKYNSSGAYQWAIKIGGSTNSDLGNAIAVDGSGNVLVTGGFAGTVDFDPSAGTANLTSAGSQDIFVAKYTSDGTYLCAGNMGGTASDAGYGIAIDGSGNAFVTGSFASAPADFDPGAGTANLSSAGSNDIFFAKYSQCSGFTATQFCVAVGGAGSDPGYSIVQTSDGGYAVAGSTTSFGQGGSDLYVVKVDGSGTVQWTRTVGGAGNEEINVVGDCIAQTSDGGYAIVSSTVSFGQGGYDMYIVKLDGSGTVLWTRTVGGANNDYGSSIVQTSDGGLAVAGYTASYGQGSNDVYVVKLDGSGTLLWTRTVGGANNEVGYSIVQTSDGGLAVAGMGVTNFPAYDVYVVKLDGSGTVQWTRTVGGAGNEVGYSIVQTSDGGLAVTGFNTSYSQGAGDVYVIKLDASGTLLWTRSVGGAKDDTGYSIIQTSDGGLAVGGYYDRGVFPSTPADLYVIKLDGSGTVLWTRTFGGAGEDWGYSIVQTSDGGFAVAGRTTSFGSGGNDVYIIKIAP